jgi:uncharacterized membrane protein
MSEYIFILRIFHIVFGIFWAGAVMILAWYLLPAVRKAGADGPKMMAAITGTNSFPTVVALSGIISIVAGCLLIWEVSGGLQPEWMGSPLGICLSTGGTLAIVALTIGLSVSRPSVMKLQKIGASVAQSGNPPSDEQKATMAKLQKRVYTASQIVAGLIAICVLFMAIARYAHIFSAA